MPDDNQTAAAGLMANQTVTEPRSAVEAASDPSHGGSIQHMGQLVDGLLGKPITDSVAPRTIVSGVERLKTVASGSRMIVNEFGGVVRAMTGRAEGAVEREVDEAAVGTADAIHSALDVIEEAFGRLLAMVQRAKAAHG